MTALKAIAPFLILILLGCDGVRDDNASAKVVPTSKAATEDYSAWLKAQENAYSAKPASIIGEQRTTIPFEVRTNNKADFEDGIIPWANIGSPEKDIPQLVDRSSVVIPESEVTILLDYPLTRSYQFNVKSKDGFTREQLLNYISGAYYKVYKEEEQSATVKTIPTEKRTTTYNRNRTDGMYGIWGHDIADLVLSEIVVYKLSDGKIILSLNIES